MLDALGGVGEGGGTGVVVGEAVEDGKPIGEVVTVVVELLLLLLLVTPTPINPVGDEVCVLEAVGEALTDKDPPPLCRVGVGEVAGGPFIEGVGVTELEPPTTVEEAEGVGVPEVEAEAELTIRGVEDTVGVLDPVPVPDKVPVALPVPLGVPLPEAPIDGVVEGVLLPLAVRVVDGEGEEVGEGVPTPDTVGLGDTVKVDVPEPVGVVVEDGVGVGRGVGELVPLEESDREGLAVPVGDPV